MLNFHALIQPYIYIQQGEGEGNTFKLHYEGLQFCRGIESYILLQKLSQKINATQLREMWSLQFADRIILLSGSQSSK